MHMDFERLALRHTLTKTKNKGDKIMNEYIDQTVEASLKNSSYYLAFEGETDMIFAKNGAAFYLSSQGVQVQQFDEEEGGYLTTIENLCHPVFISNVARNTSSGELFITIAYVFREKWYHVKVHSSEINENICYKLMQVGFEFKPTQVNKVAFIHYLSVLVNQMYRIDYICEKDQHTKLNNASIFDALVRKLIRLKNRIQRRINAIEKEEQV